MRTRYYDGDVRKGSLRKFVLSAYPLRYRMPTRGLIELCVFSDVFGALFDHLVGNHVKGICGSSDITTYF